MSQEVNKYSSAKIYKIWSPSHEDIVYYGSTVDKLCKRLSVHKCHYKLYKAGKYNFVTSFKIFDKCDDYRIDLVENYPCSNKEMLNSKEGEYIRLNVCVNKVIPDRTHKEYRDDNKDEIKEYTKEYNKQYRIDNIQKLLEQKKQYYDTNRDKINTRRKELYEANKEQAKIYYKKYNEANKDKILEKNKEYRQANRDKINQKKRQHWEANKERINARRRELRLLKK